MPARVRAVTARVHAYTHAHGSGGLGSARPPSPRVMMSFTCFCYVPHTVLSVVHTWYVIRSSTVLALALVEETSILHATDARGWLPVLPCLRSRLWVYVTML